MSVAERFLKRIPQYTRNKRHLQTLRMHGTVRKWSNFLRAELERKRRRIALKSRPYLMVIDPCNYCNLRCPLCPTGTRELGRPQAMLSLEDFRRYFDPFAPYLFEAYLHSWGEAFLNKHVYDMVAYAQSRNVGTNISSNLLTLSSDDLDKILDCDLEYLIVSLDGTSQETYGRYRIGGAYERVVETMSELLRRRNARRRKFPVVEWQFIVMKHNEHEVEQAERLAEKLGVDLLRFLPVGIPLEYKDRQGAIDAWFPSAAAPRKKSKGTERFAGRMRKPGPCFYLYRSIVINPDGGVSPCCEAYRKERDFAALDAKGIDVRGLWNNAWYRSGRALFAGKPIPDRERVVCDFCDVFERPTRRDPPKESQM